MRTAPPAADDRPASEYIFDPRLRDYFRKMEVAEQEPDGSQPLIPRLFDAFRRLWHSLTRGA